MLILDDTGFLKQGKASVGVARQYYGTLGKVGNCQVAVTCVYSDPQASWPVEVRLYLPESWTEDPERRRRAGVPPELVFQTKPQLALSLVEQARELAVPFRCVVADADYGDNPNFLAGLEERQLSYVVAMRCDFRVQLTEGTTDEYQRVDQCLATAPKGWWRTVRWRQGSKGWLRKKFLALACRWRAGDGSVRAGWLLGERPGRGQSGEHKYYLSNLPPTTPLPKLAEYAHRRHAIEQFHEEGKGEMGWDQYQGRLWRGFHRHAVTVLLAYSFLVWLELRQRKARTGPGRPRSPLPPAGPQKEGAALGAPGGGWVAPPSGSTMVDHHRSVPSDMRTEELTK